jgi:hypothetical protein
MAFDSFASRKKGTLMLIASLLIVSAFDAPSSRPANPLQLAEQGLLQCWVPDSSKKTCRVIASYRKTGPGMYDNEAKVALSSQGPMTVETHTPVSIRGDAVCGQIRTQEILAGTLRKGDEIVSSADAQPVLNQVARLVAPLDGQETCTRYEPSGPNFKAKISIAGTYRPEHDTEVKWIGPADGYAVTP